MAQSTDIFPLWGKALAALGIQGSLRGPDELRTDSGVYLQMGVERLNQESGKDYLRDTAGQDILSVTKGASVASGYLDFVDKDTTKYRVIRYLQMSESGAVGAVAVRGRLSQFDSGSFRTVQIFDHNAPSGNTASWDTVYPPGTPIVVPPGFYLQLHIGATGAGQTVNVSALVEEYPADAGWPIGA